jgi:hypothetical protein
MIRSSRRVLARLFRQEEGAVLAEFAIVLPVMLLFFVVIVESARMMWSYQMAIEGVRDAGRYVGRTAPVDICRPGGGTALGTSDADLKRRVETSIGGTPLFPAAVTVNSVTATHTCISGGFRTDPAPVARVEADLTIAFPFGPVFGLFGDALTEVRTTVAETSRIFGP